MGLTPLGMRTLAGFNTKYGADGERKFREAIDKGLIDSSKMDTEVDVQALNSDRAMKDAEADNTAGVDSTGGIKAKPNPTKPGTRKAPTGLARNAIGSFQARPG